MCRVAASYFSWLKITNMNYFEVNFLPTKLKVISVLMLFFKAIILIRMIATPQVLVLMVLV